MRFRKPMKHTVLKYRNKPTSVGAETYRSKREAKRHQELLLLERAGQIAGVVREVPFELIPKQRRPDGKVERACTYFADFLYSTADGRLVCEDAKGVRTKEYVIKRKLMLKVHGIAVVEV